MITAAPMPGLQDPVCKMPLTPSNLINVRSYKGGLIYFCSEMCAEKFDRDPMRYVADIVQRVQLPIFGFSCASQAVGLEHQLRRVPGVIEVTVNPVTEIAYIAYDSSRVEISSLADAVRRAGFRTK